ncbi:MAG: sugar transferase [Oceanospirillaceae bacterium]|nr:sugar transferase [Oceanospirillaceae bacterium]
MTKSQHFLKRTFDLVVALVGLIFLWWLILIVVIGARIDTGLSGIFKQKRVGRYGKIFTVYKVRSMRNLKNVTTTVTTDRDPRISKYGWFIRKAKLDELPQLINIVKGDMSFVGPRPDVPGFADKLEGDDRVILSIRPGITGPATLMFKNEEEILASQESPEEYNRTVIWPAKVQKNKEYIENYSIAKDIKYIWQTVFK